MPEVTIYHNPHCGTSRNTLALIVVTSRGARLCRPAEEALEILPPSTRPAG